jgi:phosphoglycolate phosphatase
MNIGSSDSVLFDLDGVLVDSRAAISSAINHALDTHGHPERAQASLHRFIGPPLVMAFAQLTGQPQDSNQVLACVASYRERYSESSLRETSVIRGIPEALDELSQRHRLAVATSKSLAFAEPLLREFGLREMFEVVAAPELTAHAEDKAATIRTALSALGGGRSVMVGDRSFDIIGAHACEIPAIGVSWGIGSSRELAASGAEVLIDAPSELPGAVSAVFAGIALGGLDERRR